MTRNAEAEGFALDLLAPLENLRQDFAERGRPDLADDDEVARYAVRYGMPIGMMAVRLAEALKVSPDHRETRETDESAGGLHAELCQRAVRWLRKSCGCGAVLSEMASLASETPDAIGWRSTYSILVEVKTSRSDFLRDRQKFHRRKPGYGMGTLRFYLSPPGIITREDLPDGWGLLYAHKNKIEKVVGPVGNIWSASPEFHHERSKHNEITLLVSALRREQER